MYVMGRMFVERHLKDDDDEEYGTYEILESEALSDTPFSDPQSDLESVFSDEDLPPEPGVYSLMYVAHLHTYQDYYGEIDIDVDVKWKKVLKLRDDEAESVIAMVTGIYDEDEEQHG